MKIPAAQHIVILWENEWVIGHGIEFTLENVLTIFQSIAHCPKNLRGTAQRIGVLHPDTVLMTGINLAIADHFPQTGRADLLSALFASPVNTRIQRDMASHQSLNTHRARDLCRSHKSLSIGKCQDGHCLHQVCSVDECQSFFSMQLQWSQADLL